MLIIGGAALLLLALKVLKKPKDREEALFGAFLVIGGIVWIVTGIYERTSH